MKGLRQILGDRVSGGVVAGLAGYFLLLQLFVAALTCGMTLPAGAEPRFEICHAAAAYGESANAAGDDQDASFTYGCPCVVCHSSDADLSAALVSGSDLGPAFSIDSAPVLPRLDEAHHPIDPSRLGLAPEPRGPPAVSA